MSTPRPVIRIDPPQDPGGQPLGGVPVARIETRVDFRTVWAAPLRGAVLTWTVVTPKPSHLIARFH
jgi:hypothetical protein